MPGYNSDIIDISTIGFDIELTQIGPQQIMVLKLVREVTGLSLGESSKIVNKAPIVFMKSVSKEKAYEIKAKFEELGAVITLL